MGVLNASVNQDLSWLQMDVTVLVCGIWGDIDGKWLFLSVHPCKHGSLVTWIDSKPYNTLLLTKVDFFSCLETDP